MRSRLLALRAAVVAAVILVAAPVAGATAARAGNGVTATVSPAVVAARGRVQVTVDGCKDGRARVSSSAFARVVTITGSRHTMYADVSIKSSTAAGSYGIKVSCDGHDHGTAGRFRVVAGARSGQGAGGHDRPAPYAPVRAGGGGTADTAGARETAASPAGSGPGTPYTLTGLVLAAVAAVTVAYRSSRRTRAAGASAGASAGATAGRNAG
jgi:hypothetical protein